MLPERSIVQGWESIGRIENLPCHDPINTQLPGVGMILKPYLKAGE